MAELSKTLSLGLGYGSIEGGSDHGGVEQTLDQYWMAQAIAAAEGVRHAVRPRPWVGAVLVARDGRYFIGATCGRTGPHAERRVLQAAGEAARGATLYTTLEPCSHFGYTPPCAYAIVEAGLARCVVGISDPDARVSGRGLDILRRAGIATDVGVGDADIREQLAAYLHHRVTGRPYVILRLTLDEDRGLVPPSAGALLWGAGARAHPDLRRLWENSDVILSGGGWPAAYEVLQQGIGLAGLDVEVALALGQGAGAAGSVGVAGAGADLLLRALDRLGERGVLQVLVDGEGPVAEALHQKGALSRYIVYAASGDGGPVVRPWAAFERPAGGAQSPAVSAMLGELWLGGTARATQLGDFVRVDFLPPIVDAC